MELLIIVVVLAITILIVLSSLSPLSWLSCLSCYCYFVVLAADILSYYCYYRCCLGYYRVYRIIVLFVLIYFGLRTSLLYYCIIRLLFWITTQSGEINGLYLTQNGKIIIYAYRETSLISTFYKYHLNGG